MRNLLTFISHYSNLFFFLILEGVALYFLATGNNYHNTRIVNGIRGLSYGIEKYINSTRGYLHLREINIRVAEENTMLYDRIEQLGRDESSLFFSVSDSVYAQQYSFTDAEVINNSVNRQKNFFTLDKGKRQGVNVDMAVVADNCAAGIIVGCSENFSVAMSLLNLDFRLSTRIKSNGYFGSLSWDGIDKDHAILNEIPQHVTINTGDTVETTGYSAIFPEGVMIGTISEFERLGGDFYEISVALNNDFKKLRFVTVIGNLRKDEQLELENRFK
jgi:rod shape-determining protein MreC